MTSEWDDLERCLERHHNFEECLLHSVLSEDGLYSISLVLDSIWDSEGRVRANIDSEMQLLTLRLIGVESIDYLGALSDGMVARPDLINWGFAEISGIGLRQEGGRVMVSLAWEGHRVLEIASHSVEIFE